MTNAGYSVYQTLLANTPAQSESLLNNMKQAAGGTSLYVKADKIPTEKDVNIRTGNAQSQTGRLSLIREADLSD